MTGFTPRHVGRGTRLGYGVIGDYVRSALEMASCEVDMRPVVPGENLGERGYDAVVVGLSPPKGNPARYLYGALWAMMSASRCGGRLMFYIDDWQYRKIQQEARSQLGRLDTMFNDHKKTCRASMTEALQVRPHLEVAMQALAERTWPVTVYPSWRWGDASIVAETLPARQIVQFDPTAWALELTERDAPDLRPDSERRRRWVEASLVKHERWVEKQGLTWPVTYFGPVNGGTVPEIEVRREFTRNWGVLSPEYPDAGSGWWRVRGVNATVARAITYSGKAEMGAMGDAWSMSPGEIEIMSDRELRVLADAQWASVRQWATPMGEAAAGLRETLELSKLS